MDYGRKVDLEYLYSEYQKTTSIGKKREIERIIYNISNETDFIKERRDQLIRAVRGGDNYAITKFSEQINIYKHNKLNGRQF